MMGVALQDIIDDLNKMTEERSVFDIVTLDLTKLQSLLLRVEMAVSNPDGSDPDIDNAERLLKLARSAIVKIAEKGSRASNYDSYMGGKILAMAEDLRDHKDEIAGPETHNKSDPKIRAHVLSKTNGQCVYCDAEINQQEMHVDHIVPVLHGGPDHVTNYVPACPSCNISKSANDPVLFVKKVRDNISFLKVVGDE